MAKTPVTPFKLYAYDTTGKFATPMLLADLIQSGIDLDPTTGKMIVVPNGTEIVSFAEDNTNGIVLTYNDKDGVEQSLTAQVVTGNSLAFDPVAKTLTSTINGVDSNVLDVSALVADINVDSVAWDQATYVLTLTETSPDGGVTPGVVHTLDLSSLVAVSVQDSIAGDGTTATPLKLVNDAAAPGNLKYYGTNDTGVKGWFSIPVQVEISTTAVTAATVEDIPLEGFGDASKTLWGPDKWISVLNVDGTPMLGSTGKPLVMPAYELP